MGLKEKMDHKASPAPAAPSAATAVAPTNRGCLRIVSSRFAVIGLAAILTSLGLNYFLQSSGGVGTKLTRTLKENILRPSSSANASSVKPLPNDTVRGAVTALKENSLRPSSSAKPLPNHTLRAAVAAQGARVFDMIRSDPWDLQVISYWGENHVCNILKNESIFPPSTASSSPPVMLNITFGCDLLFGDHRLGTGNHISSMLGMRLAALKRGADLHWHCPDAESEKANLVMPWMMGSWPAAAGASFHAKYPRPPGKSASLDSVSLSQACEGYDDCPISIVAPFMIYALRRMAVALVGVPSPTHPAAAWAEKYLWGPDRVEDGRRSRGGDVFQLSAPERDTPPLFPSVELDDAVVHFRCGDLAYSNHPSFGFMRFSEFRRRISPAAKSIGIVTQPFDEGGQLRKVDAGERKRDKCKMVTMAMVEYLAKAFPAARVTVRNDVHETIALTYARMVMANQTLSPISSFSVFPTVASFGVGYVRHPDFRKAPNKWMVNPNVPSLVDMYPAEVELMSGTDLLLARQFQMLAKKSKSRNDGINYQVEWFVNDTCCR